MTDTVISRNGVTIRLTDERWSHITEEHTELAGMRLDVLETISVPSQVFEENDGTLIAMRDVGVQKYLVVIYRESGEDGFIITAFLTSKNKTLQRRKLIWPL